MKFILKILPVLIILTSCGNNQMNQIFLDGFIDKQEIVYETDIVIMHFSKQDIIKKCQESYEKYSHQTHKKTFISYLQNNTDDYIIIKDSIVTKLDTTSIFGGIKDTIMHVPDWSNSQTHFVDIMRWTSIDILEEGKAKVFDKINHEYVKFINFNRIEEKTHGSVKVALPNGTIFINRLIWIQ
jgi:hypothetical protein